MRLAAIRVEGWSGIRSARLELEPDLTALIGENDSGKRRVLEALDAVLGGDATRLAGARVELDFVEREPEEWSAPLYAPVQALLSPAGAAPRRLTLEAEGGGFALVGAGRSSDPELLAWLRRLSPVFALRRSTWTRPVEEVHAGPPGLRPLVDEVVESAWALLDGAAADPDAELERGFAAAAEVIELSRRHLDPQQPSLHPVVAEIIGQAPPGPGMLPPAWSGTSAERIGVLFVVAGLLKEVGRPIEPDAEPILLVEDLEAYMHVMTLAAAMRLIGRLRWQRIVTTESTDLLGAVPLGSVRRLVRHRDVVHVRRIEDGTLTQTDLRRVAYHLRARRGQAMFARCWLLVEGESEAWLLPELARICGTDLAQEGIAMVEYAQCGLAPAIRTADALGIEWHVLTDGDEQGRINRALAEELADGVPLGERVTAFDEPDLELHLWHHGYADVYRRVAKAGPWSAARPPKRIVRRAIEAASKPMLALEVLSEIAGRGEAGVPSQLRGVIDTCVTLAREAPARLAAVSGERR